MTSEDFARYVDMAMAGQGGLGFMRLVVEKELLHYELFSALDEAGLLKSLVFQGGTALRLCYGSNRFSEDLDFAGGISFDAKNMDTIKDCIVTQIGQRFGLEVTVKEPKASSGGGKIHVDKWTVIIHTNPGRPDLPMQKIKLEIANVPAHTRDILPLRINYSVLIGRNPTLVAVETGDEILADKLIALPMSISRLNGSTVEPTPSRIRYRDIWDIAWLLSQGAHLETELVTQKIDDYGLSYIYPQLLERAIKDIPTIAGGMAYRTQMARFLPKEQHEQVFGKAGYEQYFARTINTQLQQVEHGLRRDGPSYEFQL
jgi:predicted nucleotidyltransferase component of viral defense system